MKTIDKTLIIKPSFLKLIAYFWLIQFPTYLVVDGLLDKCELVYKCVANSITQDWMIIIVIILASAIFSRKLYVLEIGGENSLAPNVLKGSGYKRIDLSKEYAVKKLTRSIKIMQQKNSITINRFFYSNEDFESLNKLVKI